MKDSSLGSFLQQLRKENQLTQKELASQLHVTDKAVSKWERDLSAPDISLLIPLAQILGVSTTELLQGRRMADPPQAETESSVAEALRYSDRQVRHRLRRLWAHALLLFSALCLLAAGICLLCDFCLSGRLSWSLIVLLSLALAWVVTVPLFQAKVHRCCACFLALSLALIPYLLGLWTLLPLPLPFTLATAAVSLAGLWAAYGVCRKLRHRPWPGRWSRSPAHHSRKFPHRLPVSRPAVPACPGLSHPGGRVLRPDHPPFGAGLPWH